MKSASPLIVVTGANRGIGFEMARQLALRGTRVVLTARNTDAGRAAVKKLTAENLTVQFHALDITNESSIEALYGFLIAEAGHLDVLINNAGILPDSDTNALAVDLETVRDTIETNALGPLRLAQGLADLLRKSKQGRIINVSSGMGQLSDMGGDHAAYRLSKTALNAVTGMLAAEFAPAGVAVNSMCPGWVRTDMGGASAPRDVSQGADTAVWLALDAPQSISGQLFRDRKPIPW